MSNILYAAAPFGVDVDFSKSVFLPDGDEIVFFDNDFYFHLRREFKDALGDAIYDSYGVTQAYTVIMLDLGRHHTEKLIGRSSLLACRGIVYEQVDEDELPARISDHEGTFSE